MSGRSPQSQRNHDHMVKVVADYLAAKHFREVHADLPGYVQPNRITWTQTGQGHIPDVTATGNELNVFEVETADSVWDQHTADQWTLFAAFASQHGAVFWVVVPIGSAAAAQQRLRDLRLTAEVWEI